MSYEKGMLGIVVKITSWIFLIYDISYFLFNFIFKCGCEC